MNRKAVSLLKAIFLWLIIPIGVLALGFYVIGPRIGVTHLPGQKTPDLVETNPTPTQQDQADQPDPDSNAPSTEHFSPPDVHVSVEEGAQFNVHASSYHGHKRHRKKKKGSAAATPGAAPAENGNAPAGGADGGGSGGGGGAG